MSATTGLPRSSPGSPNTSRRMSRGGRTRISAPDAAVFSALLSTYMTVGELLRARQNPGRIRRQGRRGLASFVLQLHRQWSAARAFGTVDRPQRGGHRPIPRAGFSVLHRDRPGNGGWDLCRSQCVRTPTSWPRTPSSKHACRLRPSARAVTRSCGRFTVGVRQVELRCDRGQFGEARRRRYFTNSRPEQHSSSSPLRGRAVGVAGHNWSAAFPRPRTNAGFFPAQRRPGGGDFGRYARVSG